MPYTPYQDAGSAFSGGMESFLMDRAATARQARLDAQAARAADDRHNEAEAALKEKQAESLVKLEEKERAQIEKEVTGMVPGDIPDAGLVARARKYHIPLRTGINIKKEGDVGGTPTKVIQELSPDGQSGVTPAPPPMTPAPIRFSGTPAQAKVVADEERQQQYLNSLDPKSEEARLLRYELMTGKNAPAGMADPNNTTTSDQKNYAAVVAQGYKGSLAQFLKEQANLKNPVVNVNSQNTRRDNNYKSAISELEKVSAPLSDHVKNIDELGIMLNQDSIAADAHIAPMVLKAVVGGQGSGFRITQAEINQVVGARSKWDSLQAALSKWSTNQDEPLLITTEQKKELRDLARAIRKKAQAKLEQADAVRQQLDDADDVDTIHRVMTKFKKDLHGGPDETADKKLTPAELIAKYSKSK